MFPRRAAPAQPAPRAPHPSDCNPGAPEQCLCESASVCHDGGPRRTPGPPANDRFLGFWNLPCEALRLPGAAAQPWAHSSPARHPALCPKRWLLALPWGGGARASQPSPGHPLLPASGSQLPPAAPRAPWPRCPPLATESTAPWGGFPCAEAPRPRAQDSDGSSKAKTASAAPLRPRWVWGAWGWSRTPSAPVHAARTPVPASRGWLPLCFRRGEAPAASGAQSAPQGCFHRPAGVALPSAGRTCSASGLGTRAGPHTPAAGRPAPRTVPGISILTLQIAARPEILLLSFRVSDSLAQPAGSITRKTVS